MGLKTRAEIVEEGMAVAGRDDLGDQANIWLQNWLNSVAASWDWQILRRESEVSISAQLVDYGSGSGGISDMIYRVIDELWWYTTDRTSRGRIRVRDQNSSPIERIQPTTITGIPLTVRITKPGFGVARLSFDPAPDQTYKMLLPYQIIPGQMTDDASVPWFEDDETMVQAVAFMTLRYADGKDSPATIAAQQELSALLNAARNRYGNGPGQNDRLYKDPAIFPRSRK